MPNLTSVVQYFPSPAENTVAMTLGGSVSAGAATVPVSGMSNYTDGDIVVFAVDPTLSTKQVFTGQKSGSNVVNVVWTEGANVDHSGGATVVDYVSATTVGIISKGMRQQHLESGAHGNITATGYSQSSGSFSIPNNSINANELSASAILLGKLVYTTSQTSFTGTSVTQMTGMTLPVTIPAGGRDVKVEVIIPNLINSGGPINIWVSLWDGTVGSGTRLQEVVITPQIGASLWFVNMFAVLSAPAAGSKTFNVGWQLSGASASTQLTANSPAIILATAI